MFLGRHRGFRKRKTESGRPVGTLGGVWRMYASVRPSVRRALSCTTTHLRGRELTAPSLVNLCELYYILLYALLCQFAHSTRFDTPVSDRLICYTVMYIVYIIYYIPGAPAHTHII